MKRPAWLISALMAGCVAAAIALTRDEHQEWIKSGRSKVPVEAREILDNAGEIILFGSDASPAKVRKIPGMKPIPYLGVMPGKVVRDSKVRDRILNAVYAGVGDPKADPKKCFEPNHAVRATRNGKSVDLVICFKCDWVYVLQDGKRTPLGMSSYPKAAFERELK